MTAYSNAKAERFSIGELDLDKSWDKLSREVPRASEEGGERASRGEAALAEGTREHFPIFGEAQSDAEAQLYAYLDRMKEPRPRGFPPFDTLSARLSEFSALSQHQDVFGENRTPSTQQLAPKKQKLEIAAGAQLAWFEDKFSELREMLSHREKDKAEIIAINARLAEIIDRVDRLAAALPGEKAIAAVETQLSALTKTFEGTREQSAADADRITRAAKEIQEAANKMERTRVGIDTAAKETFKELGQSVTAAATATCSLVVQQITTAMGNDVHQSDIARLEIELRSLNLLSKKSSERTNAAIERVHNTLRDFLEKGSAPPLHDTALAPKKRVGVHTPIASSAPAFLRSGGDFAGTGVREQRLDALTLRPPYLPGTRVESEKMQSNPYTGARQAKPPRPVAHAAQPKFAPVSADYTPSPAREGYVFREEERTFPMLGLTTVAVVLLLASAALFYLYMRGDGAPHRLSDWQAPVKALSVNPVHTTGIRIDLDSGKIAPLGYASHFGKTPTSEIELPVLFSASDASAVPALPRKADAAEDIQALANAASRGDREAQFRIGTRFLNDASLPGNSSAAAARWLARAAEQGHVEAQFLLASLFERGGGVNKDKKQAIAWYRKAAEAGHLRAMHNLGVLLAEHGSDRDYREAAVWFARAGARGVADSQYNLAALYERGLGVSRDKQKAYFWYSAAAESGDKDARLEADRLEQSLEAAHRDKISNQAGSWKAQIRPLDWRKDGKDSPG